MMHQVTIVALVALAAGVIVSAGTNNDGTDSKVSINEEGKASKVIQIIPQLPPVLLPVSVGIKKPPPETDVSSDSSRFSSSEENRRPSYGTGPVRVPQHSSSSSSSSCSSSSSASSSSSSSSSSPESDEKWKIVLPLRLPYGGNIVDHHHSSSESSSSGIHSVHPVYPVPVSHKGDY